MSRLPVSASLSVGTSCRTAPDRRNQQDQLFATKGRLARHPRFHVMAGLQQRQPVARPNRN